jgi:Concanavalin A-like lectin/glucanases superfamily
MKRYNRLLIPTVVVLLAMVGCQKMKRPPLGDYPQDYTTVPTTPLRFFASFDSSAAEHSQINKRFRDSISDYPSFFPSSNVKVAPGITGTSVSGGNLVYNNANDWGASTSFTVAFWEKNTVPQSEPQWLFTLPSKDGWTASNFTAFVEHQGGGSTSSEAVVKLIWGVDADQWFEFTAGNGKMPGNLLNNEWHHLAFVYDETTSKLSYYVDGVALTGLPAGLTDVKKGGAPRGPAQFVNPVGFVVGGWSKHGGFGGSTDSWIQPWKGGLDQFRLYNKALSATEVAALFNSKM